MSRHNRKGPETQMESVKQSIRDDHQYRENAATPVEVVAAVAIEAAAIPSVAKSDYRTTEGAPHAETEPAPTVAKHRQCPLCFAGRGGAGVTYSSNRRTRYYRCTTCAHTWVVKMLPPEVIRIESRRVDLSER